MKQTSRDIGILFILTWVLAVLPVSAQEVSARLELLTDTTVLGRPFGLRLEVTHPPDVMIFTPRGKKDFFPFDLIEMEPEPTQTIDGVSTDAVTYYLSTFQLETKQSIALQIGFRKPDSEVIESISIKSKSIRLIERIPEVTDSLTYRAHTALPKLEDPPNLFLLFLYFVALATIIGLAALWLQAPVERYLRIRKVKSDWNRVARKIQQLQELKLDQTNLLDQLNRIWKTYLDPHGKYSLLSLTTTELLPVIREIPEIDSAEQETLIRISRTVDEVIYAGHELLTGQLKEMAQRVNDLLYDVHKRRMGKITHRQSYTRQFLHRVRKLFRPHQTGKTMWKGY